jgi:hypothetical protein
LTRTPHHTGAHGRECRGLDCGTRALPRGGLARCSTLVANKGYDSDGLRAQLVEEDIFPCFTTTSNRLEKRPSSAREHTFFFSYLLVPSPRF